MSFLDRELTDDQRTELIEHRGGCRCFISPPCFACSEPLNLSEAEELGFVDDFADLHCAMESDMVQRDQFETPAPACIPKAPPASPKWHCGLHKLSHIDHRMGGLWFSTGEQT